MRVSFGVLTDCYLRSYRKCSDDMIHAELGYTGDTFRRLRYPEGMMLRLKKKAKEIMDGCNREKRREENKLKNI